MKRAFVIVGPESSGTRVCAMLFRLSFIPEMCGDFVHAQSCLDNEAVLNWLKEYEAVHIRRSIPHGRAPSDWLNIGDTSRELAHLGFEAKWIVPIRLNKALAGSKKERNHTFSGDAPTSVRAEYRYIFEGLTSVEDDFYLLPVSLLVVDPDRVLGCLSAWTGMTLNTEEIKSKLYDCDEKWLREN